MNIPKEIKETIKLIELLGTELAKQEKILYQWLEAQGINTDSDKENEIIFDTDLHILFNDHNGKELINDLKSYRRR